MGTYVILVWSTDNSETQPRPGLRLAERLIITLTLIIGLLYLILLLRTMKAFRRMERGWVERVRTMALQENIRLLTTPPGAPQLDLEPVLLLPVPTSSTSSTPVSSIQGVSHIRAFAPGSRVRLGSSFQNDLLNSDSELVDMSGVD